MSNSADTFIGKLWDGTEFVAVSIEIGASA
jgi:hypothetical protein